MKKIMVNKALGETTLHRAARLGYPVSTKLSNFVFFPTICLCIFLSPFLISACFLQSMQNFD